MPFYRVNLGIQFGVPALKLVPKNTRYDPKFELAGQNHDMFMVVSRNNIPKGTLGMFLGFGSSKRLRTREDWFPMTLLLVGDEQLYFYTTHLTLVTEEEIEALMSDVV